MCNDKSDGCCGADCYKCLKYSIITINAIFFVLGIVTAVLSGYIAFNTDNNIHQQIIDSGKSSMILIGVYIIFASGLGLIVVSVVAIVGVITENSCLLGMYDVAVLVLFFVQLVGVIVFIQQFSALQDFLVRHLRTSPDLSNINDVYAAVAVNVMLDRIQSEFRCCGVVGPGDYGENIIPASCYAPVSGEGSAEVPQGTTPKSALLADSDAGALNVTLLNHLNDAVNSGSGEHGSLYETGCESIVMPYVFAAGGVTISLLILEVVSMVMVCVFTAKLRKGYTAV